MLSRILLPVPRYTKCLISLQGTSNVYRTVCASLRTFSHPQANVTAHLHVRKLSDKSSAEDDGRHRYLTVPNLLCGLRICMTPVIGVLVINGDHSSALALFTFAAVTDFLDGYIARNVPGQKSLLGSVLDPVADKLLVGTLFLTSTYASLIPGILTAVVVARDLCLIVGGFYKRYASMQPPITLWRFFDSRVSSMQIVPSFISKLSFLELNTVLQLSVVTLALVLPVVDAGPSLHLLFNVLCLGTGTTTVWSGLQYASGKAVKRV